MSDLRRPHETPSPVWSPLLLAPAGPGARSQSENLCWWGPPFWGPVLVLGLHGPVHGNSLTSSLRAKEPTRKRPVITHKITPLRDLPPGFGLLPLDPVSLPSFPGTRALVPSGAHVRKVGQMGCVTLGLDTKTPQSPPIFPLPIHRATSPALGQAGATLWKEPAVPGQAGSQEHPPALCAGRTEPVLCCVLAGIVSPQKTLKPRPSGPGRVASSGNGVFAEQVKLD